MTTRKRPAVRTAHARPPSPPTPPRHTHAYAHTAIRPHRRPGANLPHSGRALQQATVVQTEADSGDDRRSCTAMKLPFSVSPRARVLLMLLASGMAILTCGTHYSVSAWSVNHDRWTRLTARRLRWAVHSASQQWAVPGSGCHNAIAPMLIVSVQWVRVCVDGVRSPELKHQFNCTQARDTAVAADKGRGAADSVCHVCNHEWAQNARPVHSD